MTDITITGHSGNSDNIAAVLRGYVERFELTSPMVKQMMLDAAAEIERLTAEGKTWHDCYDNERRNNKRLTDALTKIRSVVGTSTEAWHITNRALENKP